MRLPKTHNTTMSAIVRLNTITDPQAIRENDTIKVPRKSTDTVVHSVRAGETLGEIARHYKVPGERVRRYNCLMENDEVYPGMQLIIPR